jgi:hypothetical protein
MGEGRDEESVRIEYALLVCDIISSHLSTSLLPGTFGKDPLLETFVEGEGESGRERESRRVKRGGGLMRDCLTRGNCSTVQRQPRHM